jgi:hypothetical protein
MPFMSMRLLRLANKSTHHLGIDDLESHAWVLLLEFVAQCKRHDIPLCWGEDGWMEYMDEGAPQVATFKGGILSNFTHEEYLSTSVKTMFPILKPWFELAQTALLEARNSPTGMTLNQIRARDLRFYEKYLSVAFRPGVLDSLPETWAALKNTIPAPEL